MDFPLALFMWFYRGLGGLGGWALFAGCGLSAGMWVLADSNRRSLPARSERLQMLLALMLSVPAGTAHFMAERGTFRHIAPPYDVALCLAMIGGLAAPVMAFWYAQRYRGMVACRHGHQPYSAELRRCPECAYLDATRRRGPAETPPSAADPRIHANAYAPHAAQADAWLISPGGRRFRLFRGENRLGRTADNQFMIVGDQAVDAEHARILEREGRYFLIDCGSENGTRLNEHRLEPYIEKQLWSGDVITLSDATEVEFVVGDEGMVR